MSHLQHRPHNQPAPAPSNTGRTVAVLFAIVLIATGGPLAIPGALILLFVLMKRIAG